MLRSTLTHTHTVVAGIEHPYWLRNRDRFTCRCVCDEEACVCIDGTSGHISVITYYTHVQHQTLFILVLSHPFYQSECVELPKKLNKVLTAKLQEEIDREVTEFFYLLMYYSELCFN